MASRGDGSLDSSHEKCYYAYRKETSPGVVMLGKLMRYTMSVLLLLILIFCGNQKHDRTRSHRLKEDSFSTQIVAKTSRPRQKREEGQYRFISWNIANLGKSQGDDQIGFIASLLSTERPDIIVIQEVTAGKDHGIQAVAKIVATMNTLEDNAYDYIVSDPTEPASPGVERYGCIFYKNTARINRSEAHLSRELREAIDREPFVLSFTMKNGTSVQIFTLHAVPTAKGPIREIVALTGASEVQSAEHIIVAGDFNLGPTDTDAPFQRTGLSGNIHEKTSLRQKVDTHGAYRKFQYDNIYTKGVAVTESHVIDFIETDFAPVDTASLKAAHKISDHLPVAITFK